MTEAAAPPSKRRGGFRRIVATISGLYALLVGAYLILRVTLGETQWWTAMLNTFAPIYFAPLVVLLPLALILRLRRPILMLLPLLVVGAAWFGPRFFPRGEAAPEGTPLRVITLNVGEAEGDVALNAITTWLNAQEADVVFFQEIPERWAQAGIPALLDAYPHQLIQPTAVRVRGQALVSRYRLVEGDLIDLEGDGTLNQQRVRIDVNGTTIALYNVQLAQPIAQRPRVALPVRSGPLDLMLSYDDTLRDNQIGRLLPILEAETQPYIVAGTFNMGETSLAYNSIADRMTDSYAAVGSGMGMTWPVAELIGIPRFVPPLVRLDYIWHSRDFHTVSSTLGQRLRTDHLPVVSDLVFPSVE